MLKEMEWKSVKVSVDSQEVHQLDNIPPTQSSWNLSYNFVKTQNIFSFEQL